jgi:hypothetical protein
MILAQYRENYATHNEDWDGIKEGWKAKGGVDFVVDMDTQDRLYSTDENIKAAATAVLSSMSNLYVRYEFLSYEFLDSNPIDITKEFMAELEKCG